MLFKWSTSLPERTAVLQCLRENSQSNITKILQQELVASYVNICIYIHGLVNIRPCPYVKKHASTTVYYVLSV